MADQQQWHWWYVTKRKYLEVLVQNLSLPKDAKILDLGSGVGANFPVLRTFGEVTGVEQSKDGRALSQAHHIERVMAGDLNTYQPAKAVYDLITILDVLYHQSITDDVDVIRRALSGLKKEGYLLITDCAHPSLFGPHDVSNMARQRYTMSELANKIEKAGGKVVRKTYLFGFSFPFFAATRLYQKSTNVAKDDKAHNGVVNTVLSFLGKVEAASLRLWNIPFGSTLCFLVQKS